MSQENLILARGAFAANNERDLDGMLALLDEDVESVSRIAAIEGPLRGHEGFRRSWDAWFGAFPGYQLEVVEMKDHRDAVIIAFRASGHVAGSDLPFEGLAWHVSRWREGKCVWWKVCLTAVEALEAAGPSG